MTQELDTQTEETVVPNTQTPSVTATDVAQQAPSQQETPPSTRPAADRVRYTPKKRRRRFGDRKEGRRLRSLEPINYIAPFIMDKRNGSCNYIADRIDIAKIEAYLKEKKQQGYVMTLMHVFIAAYIHTVAAYPAINRFISGQRIYARKNIEVMLTVKKEMTLNGTETVVKGVFRPDDTIYDVYDEFNRLITAYRENKGNSMDRVAKMLTHIPRVFLRGVIKMLKFFDYFGKLPRWLLRASCFHGSFFVTSMGSLGIPPIYHHLYDFGNVPVFLAFGAKQRANVLEDDGSVRRENYVDFTVVTDERICDGFYFAAALKHLKHLLKNPQLLDAPPTEIVEDVD